LEVYNVHRAATVGSDRVIVVEGYFDCLQVHQAGFRCVVALMGCALSGHQETLLRERFKGVLLMLDGDEAGREASRALAARLSKWCSVGVVRVPDGAQPDQLPPEVIRRLLETPQGEKRLRQTLTYWRRKMVLTMGATFGLFARPLQRRISRPPMV
jgi:DNA primase